jgi:hypothetical protein
MRQLYGDTLNPFISDSGPQWANKLLEHLTGSDHVMWGVLRKPIAGVGSLHQFPCAKHRNATPI